MASCLPWGQGHLWGHSSEELRRNCPASRLTASRTGNWDDSQLGCSEPQGCKASAEMNADRSESFKVFLAKQLRDLEEALITWHNEEMVSISKMSSNGTESANQGATESIHVELLDSREDEEASSELIMGARPSVEDTVMELACTPPSLAHADKRPSPPHVDKMLSLAHADERPSLPHLNKMLGKCQDHGVRWENLDEAHAVTGEESGQVTKNHSDMMVGLHSMFEARASTSPTPISRSQLGGMSQSATFLDAGQNRAGDELRDGPGSCLVSHPLTARRLAYDLTTMVLISYELLVIPLEFTGLVGTHTWFDVLLAAVWTIDLVQGFFRGFQEYGVVDLRLRSTVLAYVKSWFALDFALVLLDWSLLLLTHVVTFAGVVRSVKTLRFWRALKMLKFLRWYRMPRLYMSTHEFVRSDLAQTVLTIVSWILVLLMLSHLIACFWFLLGKAPEETPSWVQVAKEYYISKSHGEEPPDWYFYVTALHWAVTQFTPASMEVRPENLGERVYNLVAIFISLVLFPTFLTSITNCVSAFRKKNSDYSLAKRNLSQYLQDNRISLDLATRIQSVVCAQFENKRRATRMHESDVSLLKLLPRSLKEQMHSQVYQAIVIRYPILNFIAGFHERTLTKICDMAMGQQSLGSAEELFAYGKEAEHVYFVVSGCLLYLEGASPYAGIREEVSEGWFCDQVLWIKWVHLGQMTGLQPCELVTLNSASFRKIVGQKPLVRSICHRFAECYYEAITDEMHNDYCNDLGFSTEKLDNIVSVVAMVATSSDE